MQGSSTPGILNIAVNTRLLIKGRLDGIGRFTYETLRRITRSHPEHRFFFLFDRPWDDQHAFPSNVTPLVVHPQARHPLLYLLWFDVMVPRVLKRIQADLFVSPDGFLPRRLQIPTLAVVHDLNFIHYPMDVPKHDRWFYHTFFPQYVSKASRIATVSEYSADDIQQVFGIPRAGIDVVYNGVSDHFRPLTPEAIIRHRQHLTKGRPYFLFIGAQHPRKNLSKLFQAFDLLRKRGNDAALVIAGPRQWWTRDIQRAYDGMQFKADVVFTGRLDEDNLNTTLASATALTYVSYFEGFGIPILEAFQCQVPVITSRVTSMPEVAGDAALLVDPFDIESITDAMQGILSDEFYRADLISRGQQRLQLFSWDRTASLLFDSMMRSLNTNV